MGLRLVQPLTRKNYNENASFEMKNAYLYLGPRSTLPTLRFFFFTSLQQNGYGYTFRTPSRTHVCTHIHPRARLPPTRSTQLPFPPTLSCSCVIVRFSAFCTHIFFPFLQSQLSSIEPCIKRPGTHSVSHVHAHNPLISRPTIMYMQPGTAATAGPMHLYIHRHAHACVVYLTDPPASLI